MSDAAASANPHGDPLTLDLDGWEGPLDLLLALARAQRVDLKAISILELADQYIAHVENARALSIELAADYLVMAAWLALLKSALLLPREEAPDPDPDALAAALSHRLQRLAAMRDAGARLMARDRLGRDSFARGAPEGLHVDRRSAWQAGLFDLIAAYGAMRARTRPVVHMVRARDIMTLDVALERLAMALRARPGWQALPSLVPAGGGAALRRSVLASSFLAALELARTGRAELAQDGAFAPLLVRGGE